MLDNQGVFKQGMFEAKFKFKILDWSVYETPRHVCVWVILVCYSGDRKGLLASCLLFAIADRKKNPLGKTENFGKMWKLFQQIPIGCHNKN